MVFLLQCMSNSLYLKVQESYTPIFDDSVEYVFNIHIFLGGLELLTIRLVQVCQFTTMLLVDNVFVVMLISWYCAKPSDTARTNFTRQPLLGYQCVLNDPSYQITRLNTARAQCVWRCLSRDDCVVVSHNHRLNSCELSMQLCDRVAAHGDFSINMYGMDRPLCSHWVSISGFDAQKAVVFPQISIGTQNIAVARKRTNSGLFPGKYMLF